MKFFKFFAIAIVLGLYLIPHNLLIMKGNTVQDNNSVLLENPSLVPKPPVLGEALHDLTPDQQKQFDNGKAEFERIHVPVDGLGPTFNAESCKACHDAPLTGGSLGDRINLSRRIGRIKDGKFDGLVALGGSVVHRKSIAGLLPDCKQEASYIPPEAEILGLRAGQALFGIGLLEAVPSDSISANADPDDKNNDGISGRVNMVKSTPSGEVKVGRFGWKAQQPTLFDITGDAYLNQMGITSPNFPKERQPNGKPAECDAVADPEDTNGDQVRRLTDFIILLAPPPRENVNNAVVKQGEKIFSNIGCAMCHFSTLKTGANSIAALANKEFHPYTDLLLHDMGSDLADKIVQGEATGDEWRTAPLWGLSKKKFFLHDARTEDVTTAIVLHGGEALKSRQRFIKLTNSKRGDLLKFLSSL